MISDKKDFSPPAWLVLHFGDINLDTERAQKFHDMRVRMCQQLGKENEACYWHALWLKALDLLLEHDPTMHIKDTELQMLKDTKSEQEWNEACDTIKKAYGGQYPIGWLNKVLLPGMPFTLSWYESHQ